MSTSVTVQKTPVLKRKRKKGRKEGREGKKRKEGKERKKVKASALPNPLPVEWAMETED